MGLIRGRGHPETPVSHARLARISVVFTPTHLGVGHPAVFTVGAAYRGEIFAA